MAFAARRHEASRFVLTDPLCDFGPAGTDKIFGILRRHVDGAVWADGEAHDLTAEKLLEHSRLPLAWHDQRTVLGFA